MGGKTNGTFIPDRRCIGHRTVGGVINCNVRMIIMVQLQQLWLMVEAGLDAEDRRCQDIHLVFVHVGPSKLVTLSWPLYVGLSKLVPLCWSLSYSGLLASSIGNGEARIRSILRVTVAPWCSFPPVVMRNPFT